MSPEPQLPSILARAREALLSEARRTPFAPKVTEEGRVRAVHDGVVEIEGLASGRSEEIVWIGPERSSALLSALLPDQARAILLDSADLCEQGMRVVGTQRVAMVPVGDGWLGRVIDPLGRPLDGVERPPHLNHAPIERAAPAINERAEVTHPLYTGVLAIDAMFPIGRGQRELLLGEEGTVKPSIAIDVLLRQKTTGVVCVYAAVGRRRSDTWQLVDTLRARGGRWIVVAAPEDTSPAMRYIAPYAATSVAEYFRDRGQHALILYDDLSAHAGAWRELSLLLRRPPGREAYPGDIFYLHSRLLERSAQLHANLGGGSLTAIPICRLEAGGMTAYIPTNLVSITDGQIVLNQELFAAGQKPAIAAGLSVSRVGASAQSLRIRKLSQKLRLEYSSFLELESFSKLGTRLEESTEERLQTGRALRALLRAPRLSPLDLFSETVRLVLASDAELLRAVTEHQVAGLAEAVDAELRAKQPDLVDSINRDEDQATDVPAALHEALVSTWQRQRS